MTATIRSYREAAGDFAALLRLIEELSAPERVMTPASLRSFLSVPGYRPETDLFVAPAAGGDLSGARDVRVTARGNEDPLILESWGAVPPGEGAESLALSLLRTVQERARGIVAERGRRAGILQARCDDEDTASQRVFAAAGLRFARPLVSMLRPHLDGIDPPRLPAGIELRRYWIGEDDAAWVAAFNEAFADHWGGFMGMSLPRWRHELADPAFDPTVSLVAVAGSQIAGFCHGRIDRELNALNHRQVGTIRYVGVRPRWRGLGLGSALTRAGMRSQREAGMTMVTLGVDAENLTGAHRLYERLGFTIVGRQLMYRGSITPTTAGGTA